MKIYRYVILCILYFTTYICCYDEGLERGSLSKIGNAYWEPQKAQDYIEEVLELIQTHSIKKYQIDWKEYRNTILNKSLLVYTEQGVYDLLKQAVHLLGDKHSFFVLLKNMMLFSSNNLLNNFHK